MFTQFNNSQDYNCEKLTKVEENMTYSKSFNLILCALLLNVFLITNALAEGSIRTLPAVSKDSKASLMQALQERKSLRNYNDTNLNLQVLGDLLWATWGINRVDGKHTIPTALDKQEIEVYVALEDGIWLYEPKKHAIIRKQKADLRSKAGGGAAVLIYAAPDDKFAPYHVGSLYQNAGLYAASMNLGNVVRMSSVRNLRDILVLPKGYKIHMVQSIGYVD